MTTTSKHTVGPVDAVTHLFAVSEQACSPMGCATGHVGGGPRALRVSSPNWVRSLPKTRLHSVSSVGGNCDVTTLAWRRPANERARWRNLTSQWLPSRERMADVWNVWCCSFFLKSLQVWSAGMGTARAWISWNLKTFCCPCDIVGVINFLHFSLFPQWLFPVGDGLLGDC